MGGVAGSEAVTEELFERVEKRKQGLFPWWHWEMAEAQRVAGWA